MSQVIDSADKPQAIDIDSIMTSSENSKGLNGNGFEPHHAGIFISLKPGGSDTGSLPHPSRTCTSLSNGSIASTCSNGESQEATLAISTDAEEKGNSTHTHEHRHSSSTSSTDVISTNRIIIDNEKSSEIGPLDRPLSPKPVRPSMYDNDGHMDPIQATHVFFKRDQFVNPPHSSMVGMNGGADFGTNEDMQRRDDYSMGSSGNHHRHHQNSSGEIGGYDVQENERNWDGPVDHDVVSFTIPPHHQHQQQLAIHEYQQYENEDLFDVNKDAVVELEMQHTLVDQQLTVPSSKAKKMAYNKKQSLIQERLIRECLNRSLFVRNLGYSSSVMDVRKLFEPFGAIQNICNKIPDRGMAFVRFVCFI